MAVIKKRAHGPAQVSNVAATKYTVPTGMRFQITHIHVFNPGLVPATFTLSIGADAAGTRLYDAYSIAAGSPLDDYGPYTLEAAELIQALSGTNNVLVLTIDGELILLSG